MIFLVRWLILMIAVWAATAIVPGLDCDHWQTLALASLVLGILNTFVKPILLFLSLPFIVVTFGLFLIFINAGLLALTAQIVPKFIVEGFWPAMGGGLVISIVSIVLGYPKANAKWGRS